MAGVPDALPAMVKAYRMQEKTKQVGFEWESKEDVWQKVQEELDEFRAVMDLDDMTDGEREIEFGDILFSLINYGRFIGIDAETALSKVNEKFKTRFEFIETNAPKPLIEMTLSEMDALWEEAKAFDKKS